MKIDGITVIRAALLPEGTMWVSGDVYDMLTQTPEQVQKKHAEQLEYFSRIGAEIDRLTRKARGEA